MHLQSFIYNLLFERHDFIKTFPLCDTCIFSNYSLITNYTPRRTKVASLGHTRVTLVRVSLRNIFVYLYSQLEYSAILFLSLSAVLITHLVRNLTKISCFFHGTRDCTPDCAALFRRCIFSATATEPGARSSRISSTLVPERGSSRSS